jgi:phosphatidylglycerophosphate synthase
MLDGMVAVARRIASRHGELYNEVPDRLSDVAVLVGLGYGDGGDPALGYAAAIAALLTAYVRALGTSLGAPADFSGPMAKPHRMHLVAAVALACAAAAAGGWDYRDVAGSFGLPALVLAVIAAGAAATAIRRLARIARSLASAP